MFEREQVCAVMMAVSCLGGVSSSSCKLVNAWWSGGGGARRRGGGRRGGWEDLLLPKVVCSSLSSCIAQALLAACGASDKK